MTLVSRYKIAVFVTLMVITCSAFAQVKATPDFYINDFANVISAQDRSYIMEKANAFYKEQGSQVVVVTVEGMGGYNIEEYANTLFNSWGIGSSANNSGVLLLYDHGEGYIRIEVGYGLEGALTDGTAGYIIDNFILPYFDEGNYSQGMVEGFNKILETITGEFAVPQTHNRWTPFVVIILWGIMIFIMKRINAKRFPDGGGMGGGSLGGRMGGRSLGGGSSGSRGGGGRSGGGGASRSSRR